MTPDAAGAAQRLAFLVDVVEREARHLAQIDQRLFGAGFGVAGAASLPEQPEQPDLAERVDAFVARFGRLQDTVAGALLPRVLAGLLEPVGTVLDNLHRAERLGFVASAAAWAELRFLRNRMVREFLRNPQELADALLSAHAGGPQLLDASAAIGARARALTSLMPSS